MEKREEIMNDFRARMDALIEGQRQWNEETAGRLATISDFTMLCGALAKLPKGVTEGVIRRLKEDPSLPLHGRADEIKDGINHYLTAPRRPWWWPFT